METEELTKLVDGIYKNILDKFNPGARQMINAGKAYLKALHGAAAASRLYVEAITKLAKQAQQGTWSGSSDVGSALMQVVEVYKEIQAQQMNILKAFYVDLLVPLETNLEKDTKVVQSEQKKFLQQHKARSETYSKAAANMKKYRKKGNKNGAKGGLATDKELKNMQILEEEKSKLDMFCEQSLKNVCPKPIVLRILLVVIEKNSGLAGTLSTCFSPLIVMHFHELAHVVLERAMTQERRRYGFVLERQCSLAKHYLAYHTAGVSTYGKRLDEWQDVARTREYLPESVENVFAMKMRQLSIWQDDDEFSGRDTNMIEDDRISITSQLRKTKSMDASCLDLRSINDVGTIKPLSRAKSEFNLNSSTNSLVQDESVVEQRPKSMAVPEKSGWGEASLARAMYAYLSSGENQLSFLEGDIIVLLGDRNKGWQFGENLRTQCSGWFPLAYTEVIVEDPTLGNSSNGRNPDTINTSTTATLGGNNRTPNGNSMKPSPTTMFGDTLLHRKTTKQQNSLKTPIVTSLGPPPSLPAPIPELHQRIPRSITTTAMVHPPQPILSPRGDASTLPVKRPTVHPPPMPPLPLHLGNKRVNGTPGSLHSSNDSGFSNDPPPQPEVDYSDDDSSRAQPTSLSDVALNAPTEAKKKELLSSVRGWLLYKSALDLWDDVSDQNTSGKNTSVSRTHSTRKVEHRNGVSNSNSSSNGNNNQNDSSVGTLGRFSSNDMLKATPIAVDKAPQMNNRITVKRTKSLWKFKRSYKNDILEGMSLWKHRSLIDVRKPDEKNGKDKSNDKQENIYASAENVESDDRQKCMEKVKNEKNTRRLENSKSESQDHENYYSDDTTVGLDDGSDSVIVVNDHINLTMKRKNRAQYDMSNRSDVSQSDTIIGNGEMSNSRSDLSEQTETETIGKESFLPRMKLIKTTSNEISNRYIEREISNRKGYQTWNPNLKTKESKKWRDTTEVQTPQTPVIGNGTAYFYRERSNNKLKDAPKLIKEQLRMSEAKAKCGPWYDLWGVDSSIKS